jgi:hypothetical protein
MVLIDWEGEVHVLFVLLVYVFQLALLLKITLQKQHDNKHRNELNFLQYSHITKTFFQSLNCLPTEMSLLKRTPSMRQH